MSYFEVLVRGGVITEPILDSINGKTRLKFYLGFVPTSKTFEECPYSTIVNFWGDKAERYAPSLHKGSQVLIKGSLQKYYYKNGNEFVFDTLGHKIVKEVVNGINLELIAPQSIPQNMQFQQGNQNSHYQQQYPESIQNIQNNLPVEEIIDNEKVPF